MKTRVCLASIFISVTVLLAGCSQLKNEQTPTTPALSVHGEGFASETSTNFHGEAIRNQGWDMRTCRTCHGQRYDGGTAERSCRKCHDGINGPENCTTCHGGANNAPPKDLNGNTSQTTHGVGAHQTHLAGSSIATFVACGECHSVPGDVYQSGHLDPAGVNTPANVVFNERLARTATGNGTLVPNPSYDAASLRCNNTYCHGNWRSLKSTAPLSVSYAYIDSVITGENYSPLWTGGSNEAKCGTCHALPPKGHVGYGNPPTLPLSSCGGSGCHAGIVDGNGNIISATKHMNGKINASGPERNF
jgi:predicted CxxxxCH...CXXCH cytochrome family protein